MPGDIFLYDVAHILMGNIGYSVMVFLTLNDMWKVDRFPIYKGLLYQAHYRLCLGTWLNFVYCFQIYVLSYQVTNQM